MKTGIELITEKRTKHVTKYGYDSEHDKSHSYMDFINAAKAYMYRDMYIWPFDRKSFKLGSDEENLANAGSMIAAAIDRLESVPESIDQPVTEPVKGEEAETKLEQRSLVTLLKSSYVAFKWLWDNSTINSDKMYLSADFFNIPANGLNELDLATIRAIDLQREVKRLRALTPLQPNEKGENYTRSEVEGLLNKFCNEVMVGQASGKIPKHSNGIAQYIIDNF